MEVNVHHAKTHLSKLIAAVESGEEVIIARNGKPAVKLVVVTPPARKPRRHMLGSGIGKMFGKSLANLAGGIHHMGKAARRQQAHARKGSKNMAAIDHREISDPARRTHGRCRWHHGETMTMRQKA